MTTTPHTTSAAEPEMLRLATLLQDGAWYKLTYGDMLAVGWELRRQHDLIGSLQSELEAVGAGGVHLASALGECRDAFSMPPLGSKLELAWQAAIADPLAVPAYVQACLATHQAPEVRVPLSDEQADVIALVEFERHCGRPHPWEGAQPWVISAIKAAHGITAKGPTP